MTSTILKLNLGCGLNKIQGFLNVDKFIQCEPDLVFDLETFPWPWETGSVSAIILMHVLEHIGQAPTVFLRFMQELYRVCRHEAEIMIVVPHPHHRDFLDDPTHVRPISPDMLKLFSRKANDEIVRRGLANSTLAYYTETDFEITAVEIELDQHWRQLLDAGEISNDEAAAAMNERLNVARAIKIMLRVVKP